ncbi:MAG TPA: glucoamylase family protein [Clostridia bacterium]
MNYFLIWAIILAIVSGLIVKILTWRGDPYFEIGVNVNFDELKERVKSLSIYHKNVKLKTGGMDITVIASKIRKAYKLVSKKAHKGYQLLEFEKWLYENNYLLESVLDEVAPKLQRLPKLPFVQDRPRIYEITHFILRHSNGYISWQNLSELLKIYQYECPLTYDECVNIKLFLDYCLLEFAAIISMKSITINKNIFKACSNRYNRNLQKSLNSNSFIYGINLCQDRRKIEEITKLCDKLGFSFSDRLDSFNRQIIKYNILISNVINSLRVYNEYINAKFILDISPIHHIFLKEEARVYHKSADISKLHYIESLSRLAQKKNLSELFLARHIVALCNAQKSHIAPALFKREYKNSKALLYIFSVTLLALAANTLISFFGFDRLWQGILYWIISLPIFIYISSSLINKLLIMTVRHKPLLRLDFSQGVPQECLTMVVVSQLISDKEELEKAVENLAMLKAANNYDNIRFCLLIDFMASDQVFSEEDEKLIKYAKKLFYLKLGERDYNLFWRKRSYNIYEKKYMGDERKRGAFNKLVEFLCGEEVHDQFCLILGQTSQPVKYLIALDSDSFTFQCREIIETIAHPQNQKYDLMSFSIRTNPISGVQTPFSYAFADGRGYDVYSIQGKNLGSDLFNQGLFCGKGIINVERLYQKLKNKLPKNWILSHDIIEGAFLNTIDSDAVLYENAPDNLKTYISRSARWTRGDWQNVIFLKRKIKNEYGQKYKNPINSLTKWRIFNNINFSLIYISALLLLFSSVFLGLIPLITFGVILGFDFALVLYSLLFNSFRNRFTYAIIRESRQALLRAVLFAVSLPYVAFCLFKAICQSIYRMTISKKNLLKWNTFAHSFQKSENSMDFWLRELLLPSLAAIFIFSGLNYLISGLNAFLYSLFSLLFLSSMPLAYLSSISRREEVNINADNKQLLLDIAKRTYQYFADFGHNAPNSIVCDNYQENFIKDSAKRTSPTNIGYQILSAICAYDLKFIDYSELYSILSGIIDTVRKLKKWHGNLYNWYDTQSLKVLRCYVSTVDNGNLLAALIVALQTLKKQDVLYFRIKNLIEKMDLSRLYDYSKKLFYIGTDTKTFDKIHYDLMASEAMLTSFIAVALNKVPKEHWHHLSRAPVKYDGYALFSWSGGMFEYLMPFLFLRVYEGSMLYQSCQSCVYSQIAYAREQGYDIWGISESQYYAIDSLKNYQYKAFGVPYLALKNMNDSFIVSPYSTALALKFAPKQALNNINRLIAQGLMGDYGLYEAIDLTENAHINKTYMAHHHGMILCAINNFLNNDIIIQRFMSMQKIKAFEIMLFEPLIDYAKKKKMHKPLKAYGLEPLTKVITQKPALPSYNLLSNGRYNLALDDEGSGCATLNGITLYKEFNYNHGVKIYINGEVINLMSDAQTIIQNNSYSLYRYKNKDIELELKIAVTQDYDCEIRSLTIINDTEESLSCKAAFFIEPVLTYAENYYAHPVFNNMVVKTDKLTDNIIYAYRNNDNNPIYLAASICEGNALYETNRFNFHSRDGLGWTRLNGERADSFGEILEPVLGAVKDVTLNPSSLTTMNFILTASKNLDIIKDAVCSYSCEDAINKAIDTSTIYLKQLWTTFTPQRNLMEIIAAMYSRLKTCPINYSDSHTDLRDDISILYKNGINAARPIITFFYRNNLSELLKTIEIYKYLSSFGLKVNLILLYSEPEMYINPLLDDINNAIDRLSLRHFVNENRIKIINLTRTDQNLVDILKRVSQYYFDSFFKVDSTDSAYYPIARPKKTVVAPAKPLKEQDLDMELGLGGFINDAYYINLTKDNTPLPWSNIIATKNFGSLITEKGGGYTWAKNSREYKLTAWQNDVIFDKRSEDIVLRDEHSKLSWSIFKDINNKDAHYSVTHDLGETAFETSYNGVISKCSQFLDIEKDAKIFNVTLKNASKFERKLSLAINLDIILGVNIFERGDKIYFKKENDWVFAFNPSNKISAYLGTDQPNFDWLISSRDFEYWKNGGEWINLSRSRPSLAIKVKIKLLPNESKEINFWLSDKKYELGDIKTIRDKCLAYYKSLSKVKIATPSKELDKLINRLPYQVLCSRFFGRCGYYQAGGAYGFRDQLQDCLAVIYINPQLVKEHILLCAAHQYEEGDVQHWWHPERMGTRTNITDDLLFLPLLVTEYIKFTGDFGILDEKVPYLRSPVLKKDEHSRYENPEVSPITDNIYTHCVKALETAIIRRSHRGLSLIGGGDWNDALDKVGHMGEGESVWLSMFLCYILNEFLPLVRSPQLAAEYKNEIIELKKVINEYGWDGEWFRRAYFDNGYPLGSVQSKECKIDILSQAWAVISDICDENRAKLALQSAEDRLIDYKYRIVRLMDPPIKRLPAGYIKDYPKGVRENGGQYTHAAAWYVWALILNNQKDKAFRVFELLNPINHCLTKEAVERYKGEPYVVPADVYSNELFYGRAGWTYYTGSAAWMYKVVIENILGIKRRGRKLIIEPNLPSAWEKCEIEYDYEGSKIKITILNKGLKEPVLSIDGIKYHNINYLTLNKSLSQSEIVVEV